VLEEVIETSGISRDGNAATLPVAFRLACVARASATEAGLSALLVVRSPKGCCGWVSCSGCTSRPPALRFRPDCRICSTSMEPSSFARAWRSREPRRHPPDPHAAPLSLGLRSEDVRDSGVHEQRGMRGMPNSQCQPLSVVRVAPSATRSPSASASR
jgi:hypothetical protein